MECKPFVLSGLSSYFNPFGCPEGSGFLVFEFNDYGELLKFYNIIYLNKDAF